MKITIIRHGESRGNVARRIQGKGDYPLTAKGKAQAKKVATWLSKHDIDLIYSSPSSRALDTATAIGKATGIPVITDDRLRPIDLGVLEGLPMEGLDPKNDRMWQKVKDMKNTHAHGGESVNDVIKRAEKFVHEITRQHAEQHVCIVTHNMTKRALVKILLNIPTHELANLRFPNTAVSVFTIANGSVTAIQLNTTV